MASLGNWLSLGFADRRHYKETGKQEEGGGLLSNFFPPVSVNAALIVALSSNR